MLTSDFRYALRSLTRQKTATALVLLMLSLGIAANVAVFSLVNGLFLRPFAFPDQDRLVYITRPRRSGISRSSASTIPTSTHGAKA